MVAKYYNTGSGIVVKISWNNPSEVHWGFILLPSFIVLLLNSPF